MTDEELRKLAVEYDSLTDGGTCRFMAEPVNHAGRLARRLLELLPPVGGIYADIRADVEHLAACSENWCHAADKSDLFDAVRRGQRVAAAWLRANQ